MIKADRRVFIFLGEATMKTIILALVLLGAWIFAYPAQSQKVPSQKTFTQFSDGHWERQTCWTDGSCDKVEQGWIDDGTSDSHRLPIKGDLKHREEVWREDHWETTVEQWY
jgi:hypothetical protein